MSRVQSSSAKPATPSAKSPKPVSSSWKDRLAPEDYEELVHTFEVFDEDGSGTIDPVEINKVLEELGLDRRNPMILGLINVMKEKNKPIGKEEFIDLMASKVGETRTKDGIRRIFGLYDKDENGILDFEELKGVAKYLKDGINDDELLEMLHSTHVNHKTGSSEGITFDEFYTIVSKFNNK